MSGLEVRHMQAEDLPAVLQLQEAAYPGTLLERDAFFLNRLALSPQTCWVAKEDCDALLLGYLVAYPWGDGLPPELDVPLLRLPEPAACWFLHDCAVHPQAQGRGVGRRLYEIASAHALKQGWRETRLVALAQAAAYWRSLGYADLAEDPPGLAAKLQGYGAGACYLQRVLKP